jgi:hypothetical protein
MSAWLANVAVALGILLAGIAMVLLLIGLIAYGRLRSGKLLWVSIAFAGFVAQGVLFTLDAYARRAQPEVPALPLVSLAIVLALYFAVLKR